jgi:hypothetical protein
MKTFSISSFIILVLFIQSCEIPIDKDQAQDSFRGEIILSDNLTNNIKLGDTITISYRQSEVFLINDKEKRTVYEEDIEKFYLSLIVSVPDDKIEWGQRVLNFGGDIFSVVQQKGEYSYSRLYPKFDTKRREYIGEFKIIFKQKGLFIITEDQKGTLKFKDINAFPIIKFNRMPNTIESMQDYVKDMSEKEKQRWLSSFKIMKQEGSSNRVFLKVIE